jgi:hypothetical protein
MRRPFRTAFLAAALLGTAASAAAAACAHDVERFRAILDQDLKMGGRVDRSVYDQAMRELDAAAALCRAGHDAAASAAVKADKRRHGYPDL